MGSTDRFIPYLSEAKLRANRENAKKSTGPKTPQGKRNSSRNSWKHGILSKVVVAASEEPREFNRLLRQLVEQYVPVGLLEHIQVEKIAMFLWRQRRALLAERRDVLKENVFPDFRFDHLLRYEGQIERGLERATKELDRLQSRRKAQERESQADTAGPGTSSLG
jgi:hypothetical protein